MEGNCCYKFSTIRNYVAKTAQPAITRIVEAGVNVGNIALMMHKYFPAARIIGFEAVREYLEVALYRTMHVREIELHQRAVTYQHLYADDIGRCHRCTRVDLCILKGLPTAGPGWAGGSMVLPSDHEMASRPGGVYGFEKLNDCVQPITLEEIFEWTRFAEIDLLKMDCEGCEHSVLGCASREALERIRFIVGEYHGLQRFYRVMRHSLFATHKVNLIGDRILGAFFAERLDSRADGILMFNKTGMLIPRPWLSEEPIDWHIFNDTFVLPEERYWHGFPD